MTECIDKAAVMDEIERRKNQFVSQAEEAPMKWKCSDGSEWDSLYDAAMRENLIYELRDPHHAILLYGLTSV